MVPGGGLRGAGARCLRDRAVLVIAVIGVAVVYRRRGAAGRGRPCVFGVYAGMISWLPGISFASHVAYPCTATGDEPLVLLEND